MSTEIRDTCISSDRHLLDGSGPGRVEFRATEDGETNYALMDRADFLAAVEAELGVRLVAADAIVIERAELSEVAANGPGNFAFSTGAGMSTWGGKTASEARVEARELLALAEYLDAHPPVPPVSDEDVETLAGVLSNLRPLLGSDNDTIARRLLATGKVTVKT